MTKIACIQMRPEMGNVEANVAKSLRMIGEAADAGAELVVLPELCNTGYMFKDMEEATGLAEPVPGGPTCDAWAEAAAARGLHIVAGITEIDEGVLYNSTVLIGPSGYMGTYRKLHLWNEENLFFAKGNLGCPVFKTPLGTIGMCICYDCWFPETFRLQALQGADIVCVGTNWVPIPGQAEGREAMANILVMGAAHVNSIIIAAADRVGVERGQPFEGQSLIVSHTGWPVGGPASKEDEEIVLADVDVAMAREARQWNEFNRALSDRRSGDVYDEMLGSGLTPGDY